MTSGAIRSCTEAADQHELAAAHHRRTAKHLNSGKRAAAEDERTLALAHSERARMAETIIHPAASTDDDQAAMASAWRFMD